MISEAPSMAHYERVAAAFQHHIEQASLSVDAIADIGGSAAALVTEALLAERKMLCVGIGVDASAASTLVDLLRKGHFRERPPLPVVEVTTRAVDPVTAGVPWVSDQLQALGQPQDVAVVFASQLDHASIEALGGTLAQRGVHTLWIGNTGPGISLDFPGAPLASLLLLQQAAAICLADLIDITTFGSWED